MRRPTTTCVREQHLRTEMHRRGVHTVRRHSAQDTLTPLHCILAHRNVRHVILFARRAGMPLGKGTLQALNHPCWVCKLDKAKRSAIPQHAVRTGMQRRRHVRPFQTDRWRAICCDVAGEFKPSVRSQCRWELVLVDKTHKEKAVFGSKSVKEDLVRAMRPFLNGIKTENNVMDKITLDVENGGCMTSLKLTLPKRHQEKGSPRAGTEPRADGASVFQSEEMHELCGEMRVAHSCSPADSQALNGEAERAMRTIHESSMAMRTATGRPENEWFSADLQACLTDHMMPSTALKLMASPCHELTGKHPTLANVHPCGAPTHPLNVKRGKLDAEGKMATCAGHDRRANAHKSLLVDAQGKRHMTISPHVNFDVSKPECVRQNVTMPNVAQWDAQGHGTRTRHDRTTTRTQCRQWHRHSHWKTRTQDSAHATRGDSCHEA